MKESSTNFNGENKNEKSIPGVSAVTGFFKKAINTRRKSLAEFQEINDAVGMAFSEADKNSEGESGDNINFNKAVGEQVSYFIITFLSFYFFLRDYLFPSFFFD